MGAALIAVIIFVAICIVVAIILALVVISVYNAVIALKKKVENAWAQIDVQLRRRYDLIPNLVNTVKGYMNYEKETLDRVISARAKAMGAQNMQDKMQAEGELGGVLSRLMAVVESYPDLKASEDVHTLMEELANTENRIGFARQLYNDLVTQFNTKISLFPTNMIAGLLKFKEFDFFEVTEEEVREAPKVDLGQ